MTPYLEPLLALVAALVMVALAWLVIVLYNKPGRWWRFHLGRSRNKRRDGL